METRRYRHRPALVVLKPGADPAAPFGRCGDTNDQTVARKGCGDVIDQAWANEVARRGDSNAERKTCWACT